MDVKIIIESSVVVIIALVKRCSRKNEKDARSVRDTTHDSERCMSGRDSSASA